MSTYLISLIISDFECIEGVAQAGISGTINVNMCGRPEIYKQLNSALAATLMQLEIQEKYFGVKYPLTKCGMCHLKKTLI